MSWRQPSPRWIRGIKALVFVLALLPFGLALWQAFHGGLGVNPVETLLHRSGGWGLRFLLLSLAVTPLRRLTGANWLIRLRRMLGLYAFFYALLHFGVFIVFEHALDLSDILEDILDRPFILAGFAALVLLLPLAATSTSGMIRRLGKRWQRLHRLVYLAGLLVILHYLLLNKSDDYQEPAVYAAILAVLLLVRVVTRRSR